MLTSSDTRYEKLVLMVKELRAVQYIEVASEIDALLLEAALIRKCKPRYNVAWKDDKLPLYIAISKGDIPIVRLVRKGQLNVTTIFGPFPSSSIVRSLLRSLRRVFPFYTSLHHPTRKCLYCHLGYCPGPTNGLNQPIYKKTIRQLILFLSGKRHTLLSTLEKQMRQAAGKENFEQAQRLKGFVDSILYIVQPIRNPEIYLERPHLLSEERLESIEEIKQALNLRSLPDRIEGYDVANISGKEATASMVVATHGEIEPKEYRRFKLKSKATPDDIGMLRETFSRRFKHKNWGIPNLILVDGGIGQVRIAQRCVEEAGLRVPCIGLAKREELLVFPDGTVVKLGRRNMGLKLLQKLRDEAHRFSRAYHHLLRSKQIREK